MLEYFTYKKIKKHREARKAREEGEQASSNATEQTVANEQSAKNNGNVQRADDDASSSSSEPPPLPERPVLDRSDESFLASILSEEGPTPPLPDHVTIPEGDWPSDNEEDKNEIKDKEKEKEENQEEKKAKEKEKKEKEKGKKDKEKEKKNKVKEKEKADKDGQKSNRLSLLFSKNKKHGHSLKPEDTTPSEDEEQKERKDLNHVLDRLNLGAKNNKVVSLSDESAELLQKFTQIFKDLANGVPTAYDDLVRLISDRDGTINRGFEKLPSSLQKLVTQLPDKLTASIAPEILAAAAKSQGMEVNTEGGIKEAAQKMFVPKNLLELLTKPGALVSMLRAIVTALKTRWPAFIGVNVIWSVALMLLMFVLWYCYKRGREVRLEKEKTDAEAPVDAGDRVEELPDDPLLPEPRPGTTRKLETADSSPAYVHPHPPDPDGPSDSFRP